ncbi:MAG: hypothetical protein EAX96_16670 [Candidatus Lokiarchaeota archaeon]|nr:hypothetical protein [Candidatus Lokiarchaeota archaeon]
MADIISFLGERLAEKINKSVMPTTGFIRLSIKDEFGEDIKIKQLTYQQFRKVIENSLRKRLENIHVSNLDKIISDMLIELKNNQSLLTMMSI